MQEEIRKENEYLALVKSAIIDSIKQAKYDIEETPSRYAHRYSDTGAYGDEDLIQMLIDFYARQIVKLERAYDVPFFGKMDFLGDNEEKSRTIYVGKTSVDDKNHNYLVTDWRAPICALYYNQRMGHVSYTAPKGQISGNLKSKKQIIIEDGKVVKVVDSSSAVIDDVLLEYLSNSADDRMKSIVASIQAEQDTIIRQPLEKNLIIQGVAGSGKTTVALHRIAYLIYNYAKDYKSEDFCIIGPNKYFMNYISALLPDLDVDTVNQYTFEQLAEEILGADIVVRDQSDVLKEYNSGNKISSSLKTKCSWEYKEAVEHFWNDLVDDVCVGGISIDGIEIVSEEDIRNRIMKSTLPLDENIKSFVSFIVNRIKNMQDRIYKSAKEKRQQQLLELNVWDPKRQEIVDYLDELQKGLKDGYKKDITKRFKRYSNDPIKLYKDFINNIDKYLTFETKKEMTQLKKETLKSISSKEFDYEDLPSLMYLKLLSNGFDRGKKFGHIAIDEAQDFGIFHFYVMKKMFPNASFSTYGDIAQSLYSYRSIDSWDEVKDKVFLDSDCEIMPMVKSYRNTSEIVENANLISSFVGLEPAIPVIRHGAKVDYSQIDDSDILSIAEKFTEYIDKGCKSKAVICKTQDEVDKIYEQLLQYGIPITKVSNQDEEYKGGNCVLTSYQAKGLEFDAVIISDASEAVYNSDSNIDMKQLYVALTRALHECSVFYKDELTKPLSGCISLDKPKQMTKAF